MLINMLKFVGLAGALMLFAVGTAIAGQAVSWNLSRNMMNVFAKNPRGVWAFMQNSSGIHDPANYTLLPTYSASCEGDPDKPYKCWHNETDGGYIGVATKTFSNGPITFSKGVPMLHPGPDNEVILRWTSPINETISILGRISDVDPYCGDGIQWSIEHGTTVIQSGLNDGTGSAINLQNLSVTKGSAVYFIFDPGADYLCDTTTFDIMITSQR